MLPLAVGVVMVLMLVDCLVGSGVLARFVGVPVGSWMAMGMGMRMGIGMGMGMGMLLAAVSGGIGLMMVGLLPVGMTSSLG
jgi:hypothetical protein